MLNAQIVEVGLILSRDGGARLPSLPGTCQLPIPLTSYKLELA